MLSLPQHVQLPKIYSLCDLFSKTTASDELGPEDKTSLLASVTEPKPAPADWGLFAQLLVQEGLPDAVWTCLQETRGRRT